MCSFTRDDRGVTEPYTDLPAIGLAVIGILLFGYLLVSAYASYTAKAYYADRKDDLRTVAESLAADPAMASDGTTCLLDAGKLANLSLRPEVLQRYGGPGDSISVEVAADQFHWLSGTAGQDAAYYNLPVTVRLNDARCLQGELIVGLTEAGR